jgi:hypothetical protein
MLEIAITFEHFVEIRVYFGHAMFELVHLVFNLLQATERSQRRFMHRGSRFKMNMLREQTKADASRPNHIPTVRRLLPAYQAKNGCLAGTVASYESHVFAGINLQSDATQNVVGGVGLVNI